MNMKTRKHIIIAVGTSVLAASSNQDEPIGTLELPIEAQISGGITNVASRAAGSDWAVGDQIGITAESTGGTSYSNVCYAIYY